MASVCGVRPKAGLSPRVRGNPRGTGACTGSGGTIPACTGEPTSSGTASCKPPDYPRVYGGTSSKPVGIATVTGLSPRVRGNPGGPPPGPGTRGTIPACTGEPGRQQVAVGRCRDYPRVYGGTRLTVVGWSYPEGLSPRVRGNLDRAGSRCASRRTIPACTGEPRYPAAWASTTADYPRVYGGTICTASLSRSDWGLSPRVRGNLFERELDFRQLRTIPACTGEPGTAPPEPWPCRDYPRVYGGTAPSDPEEGDGWGLSPRVRGNLFNPVAGFRQLRTIPACTGEPNSVGSAPDPSRDYPRVYGGTGQVGRPAVVARGLSPRVRGNLGGLQAQPELPGTIPACTGEPSRPAWASRTGRDYPRVYGGTREWSSTPAPFARTIPACTGEPCCRT